VKFKETEYQAKLQSRLLTYRQVFFKSQILFSDFDHI